jgi:hypothetical protein
MASLEKRCTTPRTGGRSGAKGVGEEEGGEMSQYRFLQDASVGQLYYEAGTIASTADVGGTLPSGWKPNGDVDPLDTAAVNAFWAMGPQPLGLVRAQFSTQAVNPPVTAWIATPGPVTSWRLTGLGAGLGAVFQ